jgi:hypothetical protein
MGADKNSIQEFGLWTQIHSCTSASFSCHVHVATGVLLNLGARPNQQSQHTRSGTTHDTTAGNPNRSGRFLKPVRPLLLDLASRRQGKPVRPVRQTGQTDFVKKLPKDPKCLKGLSTSEQTKPWSSKDFLAQRSFSTAHRAKPVRPVWETGQAGFNLDSREEHSPLVNSPKTKPRSPESLHGLERDFGDIRNTS